MEGMELDEFLGGGFEEALDDVSSVDSLNEDNDSEQDVSLAERQVEEDLLGSDGEDRDSEDEEEEEEMASGVPLTSEVVAAQRGKVLSSAGFEQLLVDAQENHTLESISALIEAFRAASYLEGGAGEVGEAGVVAHKRRMGKNRQEGHHSGVFKIVSGSAFNHVVRGCLEGFHSIILSYLEEGEAGKSGGKKRSPRHPHENPRWKAVSPLVKSFLSAVLHFLSGLTQSEMKSYVLQHTERLVPFFVPFHKIALAFLKMLLSLWTSAEESPRADAFLNIQALATGMPYPFIDHCLKGMYLSFIRQAKNVSVYTLPHLEFMTQCLVSVYGIDEAASYQFAFIYIRQLALHLRTALTTKTKESLSSICNWQYIHALKLWTSVLEQQCPTSAELSPLLHPLVQIITGTLRLLPSPRFFPLRLSCGRLLHRLSASTGVFVAVAPLLFPILDADWLNKMPEKGKEQPGTFAVSRALDSDVTLRVSVSLTRSRGYKDGMVEEALYWLSEHLSSQSAFPEFPDLVIPILIQLRGFCRHVAVRRYNKQARVLVQKIEDTVERIKAWRDQLHTSPAELLAGGEEKKGGSLGQTIAERLPRFPEPDSLPLHLHARALRRSHDARLRHLRQQAEDEGEVESEGWAEEREEGPAEEEGVGDREASDRKRRRAEAGEESGRKMKMKKQKDAPRKEWRARGKGQRKGREGKGGRKDIVQDLNLAEFAE